MRAEALPERVEVPAGLACRLSWPCAGGTWVDPARRACPTSARASARLRCALPAALLPSGLQRHSSVEFLGEMSDVLHSRALLPLIPPAPFSHKGRRGSLGVLMAETEDGTQALAKKSTPVRAAAEGILLTIRAHPLYPCQSVFSSGSPMQSAPARHANSNGDPIDHRLSPIAYRLSPIAYRLSPIGYDVLLASTSRTSSIPRTS